jgi:hypothetical protein
MPQAPWQSMATAPRDGSIVIVLAEDFSCARCFKWHRMAKCWMMFSDAWYDNSKVVRYTYDDELDGYGWVPGPDLSSDKSSTP